MKPFAYERAADPAAAVAAVAREPGAKFLAGGTNLVDLMKLEVETPAHLIDVNHLGLDAIDAAPQRMSHVVHAPSPFAHSRTALTMFT